MTKKEPTTRRRKVGPHTSHHEKGSVEESRADIAERTRGEVRKGLWPGGANGGYLVGVDLARRRKLARSAPEAGSRASRRDQMTDGDPWWFTVLRRWWPAVLVVVLFLLLFLAGLQGVSQQTVP
jgi:hypothetical protein